MAAGRVHYGVDGGVAVVRLDDGKANAVSHELIAEVRGALDRAEKEASAIVIAGRPGRFSAGFDLGTTMASADSARGLVSAGCELLLRIYLHPQPVVAACTGHALAAGALLLLASDWRVGAAGDYKIGLNEVAIGLPLPIFAAELARDRLSKRHLERATILARVYDPQGACDAGYLDVVEDAERVVEAACVEARALGALPARALAHTKTVVRARTAAHVRATLEEDMRRVAPPTEVKKP